MDTVGTGSASQFRLSERQLGWKPPHPGRGRDVTPSGTRFIHRVIPPPQVPVTGAGIAQVSRSVSQFTC